MSTDYSKADVEALAETVLNSWEDCNTQSCYQCNHCTGHHGSSYPSKKVDGYPHSLDCPVLIAQDVLTK